MIDVFNYFVKNSMAAFRDIEVDSSYYERLWLQVDGYPTAVIETQDGELIGFGHLRPFKPVTSLKKTAEITYFILPEHTGRGLGTRTLDHLLDKAPAMGIDTIIASITSGNEQSINFHKKHGFKECERFPQVGIKHEQVFDLIWVVKKL